MLVSFCSWFHVWLENVFLDSFFLKKKRRRKELGHQWKVESFMSIFGTKWKIDFYNLT